MYGVDSHPAWVGLWEFFFCFIATVSLGISQRFCTQLFSGLDTGLTQPPLVTSNRPGLPKLEASLPNRWLCA